MLHSSATIRQSVSHQSSLNYEIHHHGAVNSVTGSCHELRYLLSEKECGILIDCGLFQGAETQEHAVPAESNPDTKLDDTIPFDISHITALVGVS